MDFVYQFLENFTVSFLGISISLVIIWVFKGEGIPLFTKSNTVLSRLFTVIVYSLIGVLLTVIFKFVYHFLFTQ